MNIFISYSTQDRPQVDMAAAHLKSRGLQPFLASRSILPGEFWPEKLENALIRCRMALVFLGREIGAWQQREIYYLLDRSISHDTSVIPILVEHSEPPIGLLGLHQWLDWRTGIGSDQLNQLDAALQSFGGPDIPGESVAHRLNVNPFRGERAYREVDGNLGRRDKTFAARDADIEHFETLINDPYRNPYGRVIQLTGEPGVGKTSLINAGLIPALQRPFFGMTANSRYSVAHVRIDRDPIKDLAGALARTDMSLKSDQAIDRAKLALEIEEGIRENGRFLATYLTQCIDSEDAGRDHNRALLVMHGAEKLWDFEHSRMSEFEAAIRNAVENPKVVVLFSTTKGLPFPVDHLFPIREIQNSQYKEAIIEPAKAAGVQVEDSVIDRVMDEAQSIRSLQRMLSRIWMNRQSSVLDSATLHRAFD